MKSYSTDKIRNIALIGHSGEGKTSLAEAILFSTKSIDRMGKVDDGTSTMDYDAEETKRKISISMSLANGVVDGTKINILDVPGFFDFEGELIAALSAVETALIVTQASGSMSVGTDKALEYVGEIKKPAMLFINGLNKENSNFENTLAAIKQVYPKVSVVFLPIVEGLNVTGYVDIPRKKAFDAKGAEIAIPARIAGEVDEYYDALKELVAESSDELLEKFFEGEDFTDEEMQTGIKQAIILGDLVMAMGGAATANMGIEALLNAIVHYAPNPAEHAARPMEGEGAVTYPCDVNAPFTAQVFKTMSNQFVGKLLLFKVMSGKLSSGDTVSNNSCGKEERISAVYAMKGKKQENYDDAICAGDIGALAKLQYTGTSDTLCDTSVKGAYPAIVFPEPVISFAVRAVKQGEDEKIIAALNKLTDEDPTFKLLKSIDTNEMLLSGQGETQLDIMCKKAKAIAGVDAVLSDPRISYRETIRRTAEAEGKHKKQSGGAGQFGDVFVRFEPGAEDGEFEFVDAVVGGAVPRQFIPAVEKGLREAIKKGVLAGYPMVNLKCTLYDGKYHPVDSKEIAFVTAAKLAYNDGCLKADPCFLEPIMSVQIIVPDSYLGDIMGDMNKRRGRIMGTEMAGGKQIINAEIPHGEMFKYATDLRSMTQGRGKFSYSFLRYDEVPAMIGQKIIADYKKALEADKK